MAFSNCANYLLYCFFFWYISNKKLILDQQILKKILFKTPNGEWIRGHHSKFSDLTRLLKNRKHVNNELIMTIFVDNILQL